MAEMTREEVEERLEEFAAYQAIKEAHDDTEEIFPDTDDENLENQEEDSSEDIVNGTDAETSAEGNDPQEEEESQDDTKASSAPSLDD
ncbi:MAG: hypothetical protein CMH77_06325, partial [Nitrospinae bacterium]|nr:hypothetical protein [Nitrospinota bacterium]